MSSKNLLIFVVILIVIAIVAVFFIMKMQKPEQSLDQKSITLPTINQQSEATSSTTTTEKIIAINSTGFEPTEISIKEGESVSWVNQDSVDHQVNSDLHPTHQLYPPLNTIGLLKPGEKKSLSFPTKGNYKFHDHLNPQFSGSVIVE